MLLSKEALRFNTQVVRRVLLMQEIIMVQGLGVLLVNAVQGLLQTDLAALYL